MISDAEHEKQVAEVMLTATTTVQALLELIQTLQAQSKIGLCRDCRWWDQVGRIPTKEWGACNCGDFPCSAYGEGGPMITTPTFGCTLHQPKQPPPSPTDPKPILE